MAAPARSSPHALAARSGSGITSQLILEYMQRERGHAGVAELLSRAGLPFTEDQLRDDSIWFSFEQKMTLWSAAEQVLGDPKVAENVGATALDFNIAPTLRRGLRALGTPELVFRNIVRANAKFCWSHRLELVSLRERTARLRFVDISGVGYRHYDCDYTAGLVSTVPMLFGLPRARVSHPRCAAAGGECCEFEVSWEPTAQGIKRGAAGVALVTVAASASAFVVGPAALIGAGAALLAGTGLVATATVRHLQRRVASLETNTREFEIASERLSSSLRDLSSDLHLDEVLAKITSRAQAAVGGKEFALLLVEGDAMRANRDSGIPAASLEALERWAAGARASLEGSAVVIDDLGEVPALASLTSEPAMPLGSLCAAPLIFRDELHGVLIALAHGAHVFFAHDQRALEVYGSQAAIALFNARLVDRLERQAGEDPLTGLANQRAFKRAYDAHITRAARGGPELAVIMLDIDHFKAINDMRGHLFGDEVLRRTAAALEDAVRDTDLTARLGGDEFAVLLPDADRQTALDLAERVRAATSQIEIDGQPVSTSVGVASLESGDQSADPLELADRALYAAKRRGRANTVQHGEPGSDLPDPPFTRSLPANPLGVPRQS